MATTIAVKTTPSRRNRWFEKLIAIIAAINLALIFFDLTYIHWRDFYFHQVPELIQFYDPIKGIEPHRETQHYLDTVNKLEAQVAQTGLQAPEVEPILAELRLLSNEMIEDNPFAIANKSGTLEKIKNQIRDRVHIPSSHKAFAYFWSQEHFAQSGWQPEINFFNSQIRPLITSNYYRGLGINGKFFDQFWKIDLPFTILFVLDFLARTFYISRRHSHLNWLESILRRWYDLFLLLPFWRWLRVIPVTLRLYQANLIDLYPLRKQLNHDFVINFAEEITEVVGVRMIDQMQQSIKRGDVTRWLFHPESRRAYIHVNETDEVKAIAARILTVSVYDVLPQIQSDVEAILHHTIESTLDQTPLYRQIKTVPGLKEFPSQFTENLVENFSKSAYGGLIAALEDPVAAELASHLTTNFIKVLEGELQKQHNLQEIQILLVDMLEEIKINYVRGIAEGGVEKFLNEAEKVQRMAKTL